MLLGTYRYYPLTFELDKECNRYAVKVHGVGMTDGDDLEDGRQMAKALVFDVAASCFEDHKIFSGASECEQATEILDIGIDAALKLMLRNILVKKKVSQNKLAKLLGVSEMSMSQYLNVKKSTKVDILTQCFEILGKPLKISC